MADATAAQRRALEALAAAPPAATPTRVLVKLHPVGVAAGSGDERQPAAAARLLYRDE